MADNLQVTPGSGATVAADDIGGVLVQRVKLTFGSDGTANDVSSSSPLPISDNGGSLTVDGTFWPATQPVSASSLPLPTGAATESTLSSLNGKVTACNTGAVTITNSSFASTQSGVWSVRTQDGAGNNLSSIVTGSIRPLTVAVVDSSGNQITAFGGGSGGGGDASAANQTAVQANAGSDASKAVAVQGITNGKAVPVSGTFWQTTQPVSLTTLPSLAAGTNAIGKLTANSGVTIGAVEIASGQTVTITNTTFASTQSGNWSVRTQDGAGNALTSALRGSERALSVQIVDSGGNQVTSFGGGSGGSITRSTGVLLGTNETTGVTISAGATTNGSEVDVLGNDTSIGEIGIWIKVTFGSVSSTSGLNIRVNNIPVSGQAYKAPMYQHNVSAVASNTVLIYLGNYSASRYTQVDVQNLDSSNSVTNVTVRYELFKRS